MDLKNFVDHFTPMTCILSVEIRPDGSAGAIRIVEGNPAYIESIDLAHGNMDIEGENTKVFVPGSEYQKYIPKDLNFENVCYRCAVLKQPLFQSLNAGRYDFGLNVFMLPLESDDENIGYCSFTQILVPKEENAAQTKNISLPVAQEVLDICIKLRSAKEFIPVMNDIIEDIRSSSGAELCCILLMDETKRSCSVLCESKEKGSKLADVKDIISDEFYPLAETWMDTLGGSYCLVVQNEQEMEYLKEKNPDWYRSLKGSSVYSLVLFPLYSRERFLGYIWGVNFDQKDTDRLRESLDLITYFIASEIAGYQLMERLRLLSQVDLLTGVFNRNEMNNRISQLAEEDTGAIGSMGVIFTDMNGLKYVNDNIGHNAGDLLLKNAAMILQSSFSGSAIFRAGGDEFMVLMNSTSQEEMEQKIAEIKERSKMFEHVSFSAGCCLLKDSGGIRDALRIADGRMYEDKKKYHGKTGR